MSETKPKRSTMELLDNSKTHAAIMDALPKYYTPEKFLSVVRTAINRNPKLAQCDQGSFFTAMVTAAQTGIIPDGRNGHLIPRFNKKTGVMECQFQPDYKGKVALIRRSERVTDVYAECVRENDHFDLSFGLHRDLVHRPDFRSARGAIIGVYAVIAYKDGTSSWCFMPKEEVEAVRERSESWQSHKTKGYSTPWITDEGEMWKKTAINRLAKLADLDPETLDRLDADPELRVIREEEPLALPTKPKPLLPLSKATKAEPPQGDAAPESEPDAEADAEVIVEADTEPATTAKAPAQPQAEPDDATPFD